MDTIEIVEVRLSKAQRLALADAGRMVHVGPEYEHWLSPS